MAFAEPQFELSEEDLDERTHVIAIAGEIHVSTAPRFSVLLEEAVSRGKTAVVLDLSAVEFIDSTGLSVLLNGLRRVTRQRGRMALVVHQPDRPAPVRDHAPRRDLRHPPHPRGRAQRGALGGRLAGAP